MTVSDRDKKILMLLVPLALVGAFWFLLLAPKREEATALGDELAQVEGERDQAEALADEAESTKSNYAQDYATVVRLGKAIPSEVDMPSLIVQLDEAAKDTDIRFVRVAAGERETAPVAPPPAETPPPASEAGAEEASTGPGTAVETANEGADTADTEAGAPPPAPGAVAADGTSGAPGLESIPLSFSFQGSFFELADFFHEMKRFVRLAGDGVRVNGRLLTIDSFTFSSETFPTIAAEIEASVYLSPKTEGATAGASPAGPATTPAAAPPATAAPAPATSTGAAQ